ncbi:hypothetical protein E2C01_059947 [Portunus trituberculatus]|uniref:Uncharacterized protein n=1 Tax=Portunus trituberculatus TaxID=210409 RepID=A0A5B7GZR5_PORTR|nr:hypothetical protein [Portunus trituberculatus]
MEHSGPFPLLQTAFTRQFAAIQQGRHRQGEARQHFTPACQLPNAVFRSSPREEMEVSLFA